jgi:feruloyl-CoA synthase
MREASFRKAALGTYAMDVDSRPDGSILIRSREPLGEYPTKLTDRLVEAAERHPERIFLASRDGDGWRTITYRETYRRVLAIAQALLDRGCDAATPVAILSAASIEHGLLALACQHVGVPYAPITPAYSLLDPTLTKLRHVLGLLEPHLVFAQNGLSFSRALRSLDASVEIVVVEERADLAVATMFESLAGTSPGAAVRRASDAVIPDTVAKILFTSGSTGFPKGVITTQRMLCSNQQTFLQTLPLIAEPPPVVLSWLPWHHTSGANQIFGLVLYNAGTLYIDEGRPVPDEIETTVRNLRDIAPTLYFSVPRGFAELVPFLRRDSRLRENFFSRLSMLYYSGAALTDAVASELDELSVQSCGERIPMLCGYGATEVAPLALIVNWHADRSGLAGLPVPGTDLKLVPYGDKFEARVRGDSATPGYWRQDALSQALFDDEGFVKLGDALSFVDAADLSRGLAFDGRISEDFKLSTGTWVNVGALRARLAAEIGPVMREAVVAGEGQDEIAALVFPDRAACAELCGVDAGSPTLLEHPHLRAHVQAALDRLAGRATGSSMFVARAILLAEPPSEAAGEVTDKGSINQRAVVAARRAIVDMVFANPTPHPVFHTVRSPNQPRGSVGRTG